MTSTHREHGGVSLAEQKPASWQMLLGESALSLCGSGDKHEDYYMSMWLLGCQQHGLTLSLLPLQGTPYRRQELPELHQAAL